MFTLKLTKGRSYTGYGVKATVRKPLVEVDKKDVSDALIASGYFSLIEAAVPETGGEKPLEKMTEKELEAYAAENGIDLAGASKKAEKLAAIQQALAAADAGENDEETADLFGDEE